jgi:hypothetical protein
VTIYAYRCRACQSTLECDERGDTMGDCPCGGEFRRDYSGIRFDKVMQAGYNKTLGREISSNRQFDEAMKVESAIASQRTGMEHRFERVDPTDKAALGVTDEGMDATNRVRHKQGLPTVK